MGKVIVEVVVGGITSSSLVEDNGWSGGGNGLGHACFVVEAHKKSLCRSVGNAGSIFAKEVRATTGIYAHRRAQRRELISSLRRVPF